MDCHPSGLEVLQVFVIIVSQLVSWLLDVCVVNDVIKLWSLPRS